MTATGTTTPPPAGVTADRGDDGPHKLTVNVTAKTWRSLANGARLADSSKTDVVNKSIQVYELLMQIQEEEGGTLYIHGRGGEQERLRIL